MEGADPFPFIKRAFDTIAFAKVATSGAEALRTFLTPAQTALIEARFGDVIDRLGYPRAA